MIGIMGSKRSVREKRRKCTKKKKGDCIPPVVFTIPIMIRVKTADSKRRVRLEKRDNLRVINRRTKRNAAISIS
jgi:hypothetical protein